MRIPKHIAIIPDGNRRWAVGQGMGKEEGYFYGLQPGIDVLRQARIAGVEEVTYYGFTTDNCKRPAMQFKAFADACVKAVEMLASEGADLLVVGNTKSKSFPKALLPYTTRKKVAGGGIKLNFLVNYGWEWDMGEMNPAVGRNEICGNLKSKDVSRIDMVIRWGGMRRLSGLLPVQAVYADFFVVNDLWPDYRNEQFETALEWYDKQDVTLGGQKTFLYINENQ